MNWRDHLIEASFRGAKFKVLDASTEVGRRNVLHEYPFKDTPYVEDMGASADRFTINAHIVQSRDNDWDYFAERDALILALKTEGPGTLKHPFYGEVTVSVEGMVPITESFLEGGIARFAITFVQAGESIFPVPTVDSTRGMDTVAETAINQVGDSFVSRFTAKALSARTVVSDLGKTISMIKNTVLSVRGSMAATVSGTLATLNEMKSTITTIVNSPTSIATFINSSISSALSLIGDPIPVTGGSMGGWSGEYEGAVVSLPEDPVPLRLGESEVRAMVELSRFGESITVDDPSMYGGLLEDITVNSYNTAVEALNREVLVDMVRVLAIVNAVRVAVRVDYDSYDKAMEVMNLVVDRIDELLILIGDQSADETYADYDVYKRMDDSVYLSLVQLRVTFIRIMKQIGADLARVVEYRVPPAVIPSLVLAYERYNDISRDEDIVNRNTPAVNHPGFLPEGEAIEVLSE
uniref:Putative DNA circulation protein n=1 Tax=viral metagenome TaxID=1070528 RepID=A0A6M3IV17_9ZZZZ